MSNTHSTRIFNITMEKLYPLYLQKVEKKGRTSFELNKIIEWLTAYSPAELQIMINEKITVKEFFEKANITPNAQLITGTICGHRVEKIEDPILQKIRYLDKLVDELAKGRKLEKIIRS